MDTRLFCDCLVAQVHAMPALFSQDELFAIEEAIRLAAMRRVTLVLGTDSGAVLCKRIADDRDLLRLPPRFTPSLTPLSPAIMACWSC